MTDLETLKRVFNNQTERSIKSGDYSDLSEYEMKENNTQLVLELDKVAFCFTKKGRLIGMYNWKY